MAVGTGANNQAGCSVGSEYPERSPDATAGLRERARVSGELHDCAVAAADASFGFAIALLRAGRREDAMRMAALAAAQEAEAIAALWQAVGDLLPLLPTREASHAAQ